MVVAVKRESCPTPIFWGWFAVNRKKKHFLPVPSLLVVGCLFPEISSSFKSLLWNYQRYCILENIRQEIYAKNWSHSSEYQFCSSLAALNSASNLRMFWLQSQLLNLADKPGVYSLLLNSLEIKKFTDETWYHLCQY